MKHYISNNKKNVKIRKIKYEKEKEKNLYQKNKKEIKTNIIYEN